MAIDNVTFVKALASATSQEFKDSIGTVTAENIKKIGETITSSSYLAFKSSYSLLATSKSSNILFPPFTCKLNYTTNH